MTCTYKDSCVRQPGSDDCSKWEGDVPPCPHWQEPPAQMPQPGHGLIVPQGTLETKTGSNSKTAEIEPQPMPLKSGWSQAYSL